MNSALEMAKIAYKALDDKKAEDIVAIEVGEVTVIADYFIIANGNNASQVNALNIMNCLIILINVKLNIG